MIKTFYTDNEENFYISYKTSDEKIYDINFMKDFKFCFSFKETYVEKDKLYLKNQGYKILEEYQIIFNKEIQKVITSQILNSILALTLRKTFFKIKDEAELKILNDLFKELKEMEIIRKLTLKEKIIKFFCCKK